LMQLKKHWLGAGKSSETIFWIRLKLYSVSFCCCQALGDRRNVHIAKCCSKNLKLLNCTFKTSSFLISLVSFWSFLSGFLSIKHLISINGRFEVDLTCNEVTGNVPQSHLMFLNSVRAYYWRPRSLRYLPILYAESEVFNIKIMFFKLLSSS
jgi:hypothetical protein